MATPEQTLKNVEDLLAIGHGEKPQLLLTELIRQMSSAALSQWRADLLKTIGKFQPKRRQQLLQLLDQKTIAASSSVHGQKTTVAPSVVHGQQAINEPSLVHESASSSYRIPAAQTGPGTLAGEDALRQDLARLSEQHIFQWSSHYDPCLTRHFDYYLAGMKESTSAGRYADSAQRLLHDHASDIFAKGYGYQVERVGQPAAMQKSVGGLARFLELLLAYYSTRSSGAVDRDSVQALRSLFSFSLLGVLQGYGSVEFQGHTGATVLPRHFKRVAHYLAFLEPTVADAVADLVADDDLASRIRRAVIPLLESIDRLIRKDHEDYYPLPIFGRYLDSRGRFEIGVRAPQSVTSRHAIEAHAYLGYEHVTPFVLDEALASSVALVVAPLPPDVAAHVSPKGRLNDMVVRTGERQDDVVEAAMHAWDRQIYELRSKLPQTTPYNIAREFPLREPAKTTFYHVKRTSVRNLLRTFDRRNGVRLWCSVRRSGKTTACFDFDFTEGNSAIVPQTCGTEPTPRGRLFYDRICDAVATQTAIDNDFVAKIVRECAPVSVENGQRIVFVVDEYETLFGYLHAAATSQGLLRYTIVQPLLNQLVEFARDNLVVFLGQQPDAHFIFMDQNQLAPYVEQDSFPLFEHIEGTGAGEFGLLVGKILSDRIETSPRFMDALYGETAGHPFLTVNVLCVLVDWLIEQKKPLHGLRLRRDHFWSFHKQKLGFDEITLCKDYSFFREAARQAMSEDGYRSNRWLYTTYWVLRHIAMANDKDLSVSHGDFVDIMGRIPAPGELPDANEVLRTASQANFLRVSDDQVSVKIGMLGRLAASVRPAQA